MSVSTICQIVHAQWQALTQIVWPASSEQLTQAKIARLTEELRQRYHRLVARRRKIEELRARIAQWKAPPAASARTQQRLAEHEARYARQRRAYLQRKQLRLALARGQIVVRADLTGEE